MAVGFKQWLCTNRLQAISGNEITWFNDATWQCVNWLLYQGSRGLGACGPAPWAPENAVGPCTILPEDPMGTSNWRCVMYFWGTTIQISLCSCPNGSVYVDSTPGHIGRGAHPTLISHVRYNPILSEKIDIRLVCVLVGGLQLYSGEYCKAMCN